MKIITFDDKVLAVVIESFLSGETKVQLYDYNTWEPYMTVNKDPKNFSGIKLKEEVEILIKNYTENKGILEVLIRYGIISDVVRNELIGYEKLQVCRLLIGDNKDTIVEGR